MRHLLLALSFSLLFPIPVARAGVTCNLSGNIRVQPLASFYCDSSLLNCTDWIEQDLDSIMRGLPLMVVDIVHPSVGTIASGVTDSFGHYSINFDSGAATCAGGFYVTPTFARRHEDYPSNLEFRFVMERLNGDGLFDYRAVNLSGPYTTKDITYTRPTGGGISEMTRVANIYDTTNRALQEIVTWAPTLDASFSSESSPLVVTYDVNEYTDGNANNGWHIWLHKEEYCQGLGLRHELGHLVAHVLHHNNSMYKKCHSYKYQNVDSHNWDSCEWGYVNMDESLASFFAIRSATYADTNVFACGSQNNGNQDRCSELAAGIQSGAIPTPDRTVNNGAPFFEQFFGVGDAYASTVSHCIRLLRGMGCGTCQGSSCSPSEDCGDISPADGKCDNFGIHGWRNEANTVRFLWDMIDSNNEWNEATDLTISGFASIMEGMPCPASGGYGVDGNCREPLREYDYQCVPVSEIGDAVTPMMASRDSYNQYDFANIIPGDQTGARTVNCVAGATN
jgi:hypothetical protein